MIKRNGRALVTLAVGVSLLCSGVAWAQEAVSGQRVAMNFAAGEEPSYPPGSLFFTTGAYNSQPVIYRTVWHFDQKPSAVPVRIDAKDWVYLYVNGQCVAEHAKAKGNKEQAAPTFPLELDLAGCLQAGDNVIAVSASKEGFALAGYAQAGEKAIPLASKPEDWRVWKFAPLTILECQPFLTSVKLEGIKSSACKAGTESAVECNTAQGDKIVAEAANKRLKEQLADISYNARLLSVRGVAIVNDEAIGFGGPGGVNPIAIASAGKVAGEAVKARQLLGMVNNPASPKDEALAKAAAVIEGLQARLDAANQLILQGNRLTFAVLAGQALKSGPYIKLDSGSPIDQAGKLLAGGDAKAALAKLAEISQQLDAAEKLIEKDLGAPINKLDTAIANKVGWTDDPSLMDSVPEAWGVRFNPIQVSWFLDLAGKWRFRLDPENTGLKDRVHQFGYNIEGQWDELDVPGVWEKQGAKYQANNPKAIEQSPYPGVNVRTDGPYNGFAWYRKTLLVPAEWAGNDLELFMGSVDDWDFGYWNGEEIGHTGADNHPKDFWMAERHYKIPKEKVNFGGYNVIAVRVYDCGANGGIGGGIELRCPGLKDSFENRPKIARKSTTVYASSLSPASLLTAGEKDLEMFGWEPRASAGPDGILLNIGGKAVYRAFEVIPAAPSAPATDKAEGDKPAATVVKTAVVYDAAKDGPFTSNWVLLWNQPGRPDGDLPIQLVMLSQPKSIAVTRTSRGTQKIVVDFGQEGAQALILRPLRADSKAPSAEDADVMKVCQYWSSTVLAYPMHYAELAKLADGKKDVLEVVDAYDFRILKDAWNTPAVQVAPLPPLASYGLSVKARAVSTDAKPLPYGLGEYGQLHAATGPTIRYTAPVDTLPRLGGFTSFCFGGTDVGEPGSKTEIQQIALTLANTFRPQSNDAGERIMKTVRWATESGINLTLNIDNNVGAQPQGVDHWVTIAKQCKDMPLWAVAYDLINEPANMAPEVYNPQIKKMVQAIREIDKTHMVLVETPHSFASIDQFVNLAPVDDKAVVYTFHDYDYRLPERWPRMEADVRNLQHQWLPAFKFSIKHDAPICISEYGGFEQTSFDPWNNRSALVMLSDIFRVFDQFGMMHHYYANRGVTGFRADGSVREAYVQKAYRKLFTGGTFYRFRDNWQTDLKKAQ